jgi:hypothetical protein
MSLVGWLAGWLSGISAQIYVQILNIKNKIHRKVFFSMKRP